MHGRAINTRYKYVHFIANHGFLQLGLNMENEVLYLCFYLHQRTIILVSLVLIQLCCGLAYWLLYLKNFCWLHRSFPPSLLCYELSSLRIYFQALAKEIVRSRKTVTRLYENKAQLNSISMHLGESVGTKFLIILSPMELLFINYYPLISDFCYCLSMNLSSVVASLPEWIMFRILF